MKKHIITFLLIVSIIGISVSSRSASAQGNKQYCYDSLENAEIGRVILENDYLKETNSILKERDSLYRVKTVQLETKIEYLIDIINLKEQQIRKLEAIPREVIKEGWRWWHKLLAITGAIGVGFTVGIIYSNNK